MLDFCIFWSSTVREWYKYFVCYWVGGVILSLFLWINTLDYLLWLLRSNQKIHLQEPVRICLIIYLSGALSDFKEVTWLFAPWFPPSGGPSQDGSQASCNPGFWDLRFSAGALRWRMIRCRVKPYHFIFADLKPIQKALKITWILLILKGRKPLNRFR